MAELTDAPWDRADYQRFAAARAHGHVLAVRFDNGDEVKVDVRALLDGIGDEPRWKTVAVDPFELRLLVDGEEVDVPWLEVRALADERLAAHLAQRADAHAQHVGHRLRLLRERRRMSARALAQRAGMS